MPQNRFWNLLAKKMAGEATTEEIQELEELMRVHPDWHYSAQHIQDIWGLSLKENLQAAEDAYLRHLNRMKKIGIAPAATDDEEADLLISHPNRKRKFFLFASIGIAAVVAVLLFIPFGKSTKATVSETSEVFTRTGTTTQLLLPDGSKVWLNAGSKLKYNKDFSSGNREVTLEGEAYFEVKHMPDLPFIVHAPTMLVKVLGTSFNVKSYPGELTSETSVIQGRVEVIPLQKPGQSFLVRPNDKLVLSNIQEQRKDHEQQTSTFTAAWKRITYAHSDSSVIETSWVDNKLAFDAEAFGDVALKMERWYGVKIVFADPEVAQMHLTGTLINETLQQALEGLQYGSNFNFSIDKSKNIVTITK